MKAQEEVSNVRTEATYLFRNVYAAVKINCMNVYVHIKYIGMHKEGHRLLSCVCGIHRMLIAVCMHIDTRSFS